MDATFKTLPLFKSHYSMGKSILTLDDPKNKKGKLVENSIIGMLLDAKIDTLVLVEDNVSGILEANKNTKENKIRLVFGLRISITHDLADKNEENLRNKAKYIIFTKNYDGYKDLIKIWTKAATDGFYYEPVIDFASLKSLWNEKNLKLAVPFYDSFLHLNILESHRHVPELDFTLPTFMLEDNGLPFDNILEKKVTDYVKHNNFFIQKAQTIYYRCPKDFTAYMTFRCIANKTDVDKPNLDHMCSDQFNFNKWLKINQHDTNKNF